MKPINYIKPPNCTTFFEKLEKFDFTSPQNYNPVYERFFTLSPQNFNKIHLNHKYHITNLTNSCETENKQHYVFNTVLQEYGANNNKKNQFNAKKPYDFKQDIFIKVSPLLDPFSYIAGKFYNEAAPNELTNCLPKPSCISNNDSTFALKGGKEKIYDANNASYVDGFFSFLSNQLVESFSFINGIRYYGSFLSIKKKFAFNIADDLDYLVKCDFFNSHKNNGLFQVEEYSHLICPSTPKPRLNFDNLQTMDSNFILSVQDDDNNDHGLIKTEKVNADTPNDVIAEYICDDD
jgi:hypothetical protein